MDEVPFPPQPIVVRTVLFEFASRIFILPKKTDRRGWNCRRPRFHNWFKCNSKANGSRRYFVITQKFQIFIVIKMSLLPPWCRICLNRIFVRRLKFLRKLQKLGTSAADFGIVLLVWVVTVLAVQLLARKKASRSSL